MVARSAARTVSRSPRPTSPRARKPSMFSDSETRSPFSRSRFENSMSFWFKGSLVEEILVGLGARRLELRSLELHVLAQLLLRLADVALVFEDRRQRIGDQL